MTAAVITAPKVKPKERIRKLRDSVRTTVPDYPRSTAAGKLSAFTPELVARSSATDTTADKETGLERPVSSFAMTMLQVFSNHAIHPRV
jgi:hypothetical protein